jgi:ADP-ribosylation factor protein 1
LNFIFKKQKERQKTKNVLKSIFSKFFSSSSFHFFFLNKNNMGLSLSSLWNLWAKRDVRVVMCGLDAAGKSTLSIKLNIGEVQQTVPTIGFNVETIEYKNIKISLWDLGGQERLRRCWTQYLEGASAVIFVVDAVDRARFKEAADELVKLFESPHLSKACLLVYANKQDLPNAASASEVREALGLQKMESLRKVYIQGSSATTGKGLYEGLDWMVNNLPPAESA